MNEKELILMFFKTWKEKKQAIRRLMKYNEAFNRKFNIDAEDNWKIDVNYETDCRDIPGKRYKEDSLCAYSDVISGLCKYHKGYLPLKDIFYKASNRHAASKRSLIAYGKRSEK